MKWLAKYSVPSKGSGGEWENERCVCVCVQVGTWYRTLEHEYHKDTCQSYSPGSATYIYRNTQRSSMSWFHDHT